MSSVARACSNFEQPLLHVTHEPFSMNKTPPRAAGKTCSSVNSDSGFSFKQKMHLPVAAAIVIHGKLKLHYSLIVASKDDEHGTKPVIAVTFRLSYLARMNFVLHLWQSFLALHPWGYV